MDETPRTETAASQEAPAETTPGECIVAPAAASAIPADEIARITDDIVSALKTVYDPEIPADIYELGLIYRIDIEDDRSVKIDMTLTAPGCPVAGEMPGWVQDAVSAVEGVSGVDVNMVFDPPWTPDRMSEEAQVAVGWY
jgi:FeS assembly SUF system protein